MSCWIPLVVCLAVVLGTVSQFDLQHIVTVGHAKAITLVAIDAWTNELDAVINDNHVINAHRS